jgi:hypothetical protein
MPSITKSAEAVLGVAVLIQALLVTFTFWNLFAGQMAGWCGR